MAKKEQPLHNDLIQEVEESLKQEQLEKLWKEYGVYIITGIVMAVLFTAATSGWRAWNTKTNTAHTTMLIQAMDSEDIPTALDLITDQLRPGHRALSYFTAAGILLREDKETEALAHYEQAATDEKLKPVWQDLATIMAVQLTRAQDMGENAPSAENLLLRLTPIMDNNNSPWGHQARLQAAQIMAQDKQDYKTARTYLAPILQDNAALSSLRERAEALNHVYNLKTPVNETLDKDTDGGNKE